MSSSSKKFILKSSDGETFEIDEAAAVLSETIKHLIEAGCADNVIPLPNVSGSILAKVVEYCKKHAKIEDSEAKASRSLAKLSIDEIEISLEKWDAEFAKVDQKTLFDLVMAANYLEIPRLSDLTCKTVADMIRGKSPEEMRKILNIKNDFTEEEEQRNKKENAWAFL